MESILKRLMISVVGTVIFIRATNSTDISFKKSYAKNQKPCKDRVK